MGGEVNPCEFHLEEMNHKYKTIDLNLHMSTILFTIANILYRYMKSIVTSKGNILPFIVSFGTTRTCNI